MNTIIFFLGIYIAWVLVKKGISVIRVYLDGKKKRTLVFAALVFQLSALALSMAGVGSLSFLLPIVAVRFMAPGLITMFLSSFRKEKNEKVGESK